MSHTDQNDSSIPTAIQVAVFAVGAMPYVLLAVIADILSEPGEFYKSFGWLVAGWFILSAAFWRWKALSAWAVFRMTSKYVARDWARVMKENLYPPPEEFNERPDLYLDSIMHNASLPIATRLSAAADLGRYRHAQTYGGLIQSTVYSSLLEAAMRNMRA